MASLALVVFLVLVAPEYPAFLEPLEFQGLVVSVVFPVLAVLEYLVFQEPLEFQDLVVSVAFLVLVVFLVLVDALALVVLASLVFPDLAG